MFMVTRKFAWVPRAMKQPPPKIAKFLLKHHPGDPFFFNYESEGVVKIRLAVACCCGCGAHWPSETEIQIPHKDLTMFRNMALCVQAGGRPN